MSIKNQVHPFDVVVNVSVVSGLIVIPLMAGAVLVTVFGHAVNFIANAF